MSLEGGIFRGKTFWLSQNVPQRSRFKEMIQQNGGVVKLLEKDAEIQLVDHTRKNLPPNTYSFRYVENSVRNGKLENLEVYRAGPSAARPVGATNIPSRGHKIPYSMQDDQILWDWMQPSERDPHAPIRGNKVYQELAAKFPRHTFQSYRDRYLKRLRGRPRPGGEATPTEPSLVNRETQMTSPPRPPRPTIDERPSCTTEANASIPQERKRKRSPESTTPSEHSSIQTQEPPKKKVTEAKAPENTVPPISVPRTEGKSNREPEPQPKTSENIASSTTEKSAAKAPADEPDYAIDPIFLELPFLPQSPEPEEETPEQDIDEWIDDRLRTGKAENEQHIIEALRCTSMDPTLADEVLPSLVAGKGIPESMRGVWTHEDDKCVEAQDTREIQRVLEKHGSDLFNARWEYLAMARDAGLKEATVN